jgi:hypothetical protein
MRHTPQGSSSLDEWSARRRGWYPHNKHKKRTSMPSAGLDPSNPAAVDLRLRQHGHGDRRVYGTDLRNMATVRATSCTTHKKPLYILLTATVKATSCTTHKNLSISYWLPQSGPPLVLLTKNLHISSWLLRRGETKLSVANPTYWLVNIPTRLVHVHGDSTKMSHRPVHEKIPDYVSLKDCSWRIPFLTVPC